MDDTLFTNVNRISNVLYRVKVERKNTVVNLSSKVLSESENSLLQKGLNFCPTPSKPALSSIHNDLEKFYNNLRWKLFLSQPLAGNSMEKSILGSKLLKSETTHRPPQAVHSFASMNDIQLSKSKIISPSYHNLSSVEKKSIKNLLKD